MAEREILGDEDGGAGEWSWFDTPNKYYFTQTVENVHQDLIDALVGGKPLEPGPSNLQVTVPSTDGTRKIDFVLYNVKFAPIKFDYWNTWYKRLAKCVLGPKRAYWLFYRNALKVSYTGTAQGTEKIGRLK